MKRYIKSTERKLIGVFLLWALLFLLIFEGIFLSSRFFLEKQLYEKNFWKQTEQLLKNSTSAYILNGIHTFGIGVVLTDYSGKILLSQMPGIESGGNISEFISIEKFKKIQYGTLSYIDGNMIRKMSMGNHVVLMFGIGYSGNEILIRDIWRFLLFDLLFLIPVGFLLRCYIRRILLPIRENIDTMNHFVHDAGHELKTPLAIISGNLQILRDTKKFEKNLIQESLETIDTMNESIQGLLELADLKIPHNDKKNNLSEVITNEIKKVHPLFSNITIQNNLSHKIYINASEQHLSIMMRNILENTLKYNKKNGTITLDFQKNTLIVKDTGIGIPHSEQKRIFDRFYRIHNNEQRGSGIGLTLVMKIIRLYGWKIGLESKEGEGTTIFITF